MAFFNNKYFIKQPEENLANHFYFAMMLRDAPLSFSFIFTFQRTEWHFPQKQNVDVLTYYHFHNGMRMRRCAAKSNTAFYNVCVAWMNLQLVNPTHVALFLGLSLCAMEICGMSTSGTQKEAICFTKGMAQTPNCLPALRKQNASLGTCVWDEHKHTSSDDFPLDRRRPPPRVIFSEFHGSRVNSESGCLVDAGGGKRGFAANILLNMSSLADIIFLIIIWANIIKWAIIFQ